MPFAPLKSCRHPRCAASASPGSAWCTGHQPAARAEQASIVAAHDQRRGGAASRGYGGQWPGISLQTRQRYPLSPGYLTRTPGWTLDLAREFHAQREAAAARGAFFEFMRAVAEAWSVERLIVLRHPLGAPLPPIYTFHASRVPEPAGCVDHIGPATGPTDLLFWEPANHQSISHRQHSEKTAKFDGGFRGFPKPIAEPRKS